MAGGGGIVIGTAGEDGGSIGGSLVVTTFARKFTVLYFGGNSFLTNFGGRVLRVGVGAA